MDSIEGGRANAVYEGGNRIRVALDAADQAYVQVGTHELVHYLKNRDEAGYRVVEKMVVDELSKAEDFSLDDAILERRAEYAAQDVMIDDSAAIEEIVAEAIPSIWGDERAVRAFVSQNRSLAQKVRDFIVDFVERLKQYAVDYAVDQDRTEILALQSREQDAVGTLEQIARTFDLALESAREKEQSGDGAAHSLRRDTFGLSKKEFAQFYDKIAEIKIEKNPQFQNAPDGSYIFDIENKLVYTDGDWDNPTIRRVVSFDLTDGTMLDGAKQLFTELETGGVDYDGIRELLADVCGEEIVSVRYKDVRGTAEGQDGRRTRKDAGRAGRYNRTDLPSEGKRKFSLKNESANKVDMDQTLRAGDNSVAEQTETQEQTSSAPVTVTETMRQWADKRAGQIIREYRSTIDGASVREDMAKLVSELAENGASSDALNATVNMAKGIIEKSSRLDSALRDQYRDLRKNMRETAITLTDEQKQEAANITGSYGRYRQSLMGSVKLVNEGGTPLDTMWTEWSGQYPELFTPGLNEGDQVARLAEIKTMFEPKYINEYGEHLDAAAWRTPCERRDESEILQRHIPRRGQEYHCRDAGAQRPGMVEIQRQL